MLRSMYSGISGMRANQTKLDVIGNNIANVGTTAFKGSRVRFQDMISQNMTQALGPGLNQGGTNPKQIGLGTQVGGIDTMVSQGMMQPTSRNLDVAVDGEGYFMVSRGPRRYNQNVINDQIMFTRDGSFTLDSEGNLLTSDGYRVLGYSNYINADGTVNFADADTSVIQEDGLKTLVIPDHVIKDNETIRIKTFTIEKDGQIKAVLENGEVSLLGQISMASFKNPAGLEKIGRNLFTRTNNSGEAVIRTRANGKGYGDMLQGMLEMSNVDLAEEFTEMIVASRAFQASGKTITTGDEILQDIINLKR